MYIYIYLYILSLVFCAKVSLVLVFLIRFFGRSLPEVSSAGLFLFSRSLSLQQVSFSSTGLFCRSLQQVFFVRLFTRFLYFFTRYASQVSSAGFVRISYFLPQRDPRKRHVPPTWECMCVCVCVYPRSLLIDTSRLKVSFWHCGYSHTQITWDVTYIIWAAHMIYVTSHVIWDVIFDIPYQNDIPYHMGCHIHHMGSPYDICDIPCDMGCHFFWTTLQLFRFWQCGYWSTFF